MSPELVGGFHRVLDDIEAADDPRALVTVASGKVWSNGLDLAWMMENGAANASTRGDQAWSVRRGRRSGARGHGRHHEPRQHRPDDSRLPGVVARRGLTAWGAKIGPPAPSRSCSATSRDRREPGTPLPPRCRRCSLVTTTWSAVRWNATRATCSPPAATDLPWRSRVPPTRSLQPSMRSGPSGAKRGRRACPSVCGWPSIPARSTSATATTSDQPSTARRA